MYNKGEDRRRRSHSTRYDRSGKRSPQKAPVDKRTRNAGKSSEPRLKRSAAHHPSHRQKPDVNWRYFFGKLVAMLILLGPAIKAGYIMVILWAGLVALLFYTTFNRS